MGRIRGFLLKHRVTTIFRWLRRRYRSPTGYHRLDSDQSWRAKPISSFFSNIRNKAKSIRWSSNKTSSVHRRITGPGCMQIDEDPVEEKKLLHHHHHKEVPKGYMAVYVGQKDGDFQRVLVPVIYFNHPLFGELLRDAEEEFGYNHPGAITLPCRISEFEHIQTRIKQCWGARKVLKWNR